MTISDVKEAILNIYEQQDSFLKETYDRSLSFQDGLFDRFARAKNLGFGEGASIYNSALVFGQVKAGIKTWVGPYVILDGSGGAIEIGDFCSISASVHIYTHDSVMWALSGGKAAMHKANVMIGNNTYIGPHSVIKAGVSIGSHCVIGTNTFVNKNIQNNSIVVGSPAKTIGEVIIKDGEIVLEYFVK